MKGIFNVRVYGILIGDKGLLVSDEYIKGMKVTKFPGGGLQFGEGTKDCLVREFREELNSGIKVMSHFYTTDFYVSSAFHPASQVISIYYKVKPSEELRIAASVRAHDYDLKEGAQSFRWIALEDLKESDFTLITDKKVAGMIIRRRHKLRIPAGG
jgi:8-oxo-dGTP diphosphatase